MKKSKGESSYFIWSGLILFCVVIAVFTLAFSSCAFSGSEKETPAASPPVTESQPVETQETETPAPPDSETPETSEPPESEAPQSAAPSVELGPTEDMGQEYIDKFVFLGDSTTYGLAAYNIVDKNQVWTPTNGTLTLSRWDIDRIYYPDGGTEIFIPEAIAAKKPEYILITLGVNGVSFMDETSFIACYESLVQAIQAANADTKIILNTIYPVGVNYSTPGITNERISAANEWVRKIAENTGVRFLNSASVLMGENGALVESYHNGDSLHLNSEAFNLVINYIRTHGYV